MALGFQDSHYIFKTHPFMLIFSTTFLYLTSLYFGQLQRSAGDIQTLVITSQMGIFFTTLIVNVLLFFLIPYAVLQRQGQLLQISFWRWSNSSIWPLAIEGLRVLARLLMWSILLILPAFYWYCRYIFVAYIVLLDQNYKQGQIDALEHSKLLTRNIALDLLVFQIVTGAIGFALDTSESWFPLLNTELVRLVATCLSVSLMVYSYCVIFQLYLLHSTPTKLEGDSNAAASV